MPYVKTPLLSYIFPNVGSYPLSAVDWNLTSPAGVAQGVWVAPNDVRVADAGVSHRDWWNTKLAFNHLEQYATLKVVNNVSTHTDFTLNILANAAAANPFSTGYAMVAWGIGGGIAVDGNIRRSGVIVATPHIAINIGDTVELRARQTGPTQLTVSVLVNNVVQYSFVDNAPLTAPGAFGWYMEALTNPSSIDIGSLEFGYETFVNPIQRKVIDGHFLPLPTVKA